MLPPPRKRKLNPMLLNVLLISGGLHLVALFILGGITVVKYMIPDEADFEEPPAVVEEEPPPEVKIEIQQKPNQQPSQLNNLQMKPVSNITVDAVDVNLPDIADTFTVSAGLGGSGGGNMLGGTRGSIGLGMSDVSVFGLKTRAERILFVIDANRQMVTDKKGGLNSYKIIKDEITDMVGNLSAGTLFNVVMQDRRKVKMFKPQLVSAGSSTHSELVAWIGQINSDPYKPGLEGIADAKEPKLTAMPENEIQNSIGRTNHRGNETCFITQFALEQSADAIFFITGYHRGFEGILSPPSEKQRANFAKLKASKQYQDDLAAHNLEKPIMQKRIDAEMKKINAARAKKGQPPRVLDQRHGIYSNTSELGFKWKTKHPGRGPGNQRVDERLVSKYFKQLMETLYEDREMTPPSVNVVLFLAGDEDFRETWEDSLNNYTRYFRGKHRVIRGKNEIKSARSSSEANNN